MTCAHGYEPAAGVPRSGIVCRRIVSKSGQCIPAGLLPSERAGPYRGPGGHRRGGVVRDPEGGPMNSVFQKYANLYDLFYAKKDYSRECAYILNLLTRHLGRKPKSILDLGCGTGGHALIWASKGVAVTGLDRSEAMLEQARRTLQAVSGRVLFVNGDVRKFNLGKKFD